jgi:predicted dehydrogenase
MKRRDFLKSTAIAPLILPAAVARARQNGPNETVNVGLIGLGGRCRTVADTTLGIPGVRIVAACDCFKPRVDECMKNKGAEQGWKGYLDFREMIEKENLDGVMVETTTHTGAWISCLAMEAGMDVFIEKPMALTIAEGRAMVSCARKHQRITQVGTQQRSIPLNNFASDLVQNGAIGRVKEVLAPDFMGPAEWTPKPAEEMPWGDHPEWWDIWTNQAPMRPYHSQLHRGWNRWRAYDGGGQSFGVTGWGAHSYDQVQRGLGTDETGPVSIVLEEAVKDRSAARPEAEEAGPGKTGAPYYHMVAKAAGPRAKVRMTYADGTVLKLHYDANNGPGLGCIFAGEKGRIEINRDQIAADDPALFDSPDNPGHLKVPETQPHIENWAEGIRTRKTCTADIEYGHRANSICCLVNIVRELGKAGEELRWDPEKEQFTNCEEGNAMLARPRREGYELPA